METTIMSKNLEIAQLKLTLSRLEVGTSPEDHKNRQELINQANGWIGSIFVGLGKPSNGMQVLAFRHDLPDVASFEVLRKARDLMAQRLKTLHSAENATIH